MITPKEIEVYRELARDHAFENSDNVILDLLDDIEKLQAELEERHEIDRRNVENIRLVAGSYYE